MEVEICDFVFSILFSLRRGLFVHIYIFHFPTSSKDGYCCTRNYCNLQNQSVLNAESHAFVKPF